MELQQEEITVTIGSSATVSAWFVIKPWAYFISLITGTLTAGNIGLQVSLDGGSTVVTVVDLVTQANAIILTSAAENNKMVDIGDLIRSMGAGAQDVPENEQVVRLTCASQGSARTVTIKQRGG